MWPRAVQAGDRGGPGTAEAGEAGVSTVLAAIISLALVAVLWFGMQVGAATISRHRAEGAADLAALAAAAYAPHGRVVACARATRVVRRMHGSVVSCRLDGWESRVRVRMPLPGMLTRMSIVEPAEGRARAGPVPPR